MTYFATTLMVIGIVIIVTERLREIAQAISSLRECEIRVVKISPPQPSENLSVKTSAASSVDTGEVA